jgi:outer membrane biosynthesis protein TonB
MPIRKIGLASLQTTIVILLSASSVLAQQTAYTLNATPKTVAWGYYDAKAAPVPRVKSGDTVETQAPVAPSSAQEEKQRIVYVKHLEPPYYPPLARMTRVSGTIEMKLKIGAGGAVLSVESTVDGAKGKVRTMLKDEAEKNIKTWTFGCVGCPAGAPFEHTVRFKYVQDMSLPERTIKTVMDLPDEVTMSAGPIPLEPASTSTKENQ